MGMNFRIFTLLSLCLVPLSLAESNDPAMPNKTVDKLLPNQKAFFNLPEEDRNQFLEHFNEANRLFSQKRVFETLEVCAKAHKVFPGSPEIYNMKGSCYVELRAFDKALAAFRKADKLSEDNRSIQFNIAEVHFVTRDWQKAHDSFSELLSNLPDQDLALGRLAEYKVLLCKIKLGDLNGAKIMAEKYDYLDDSPFYYFAKAALAYQEEELLEAEQWLGRAARIFRNRALLAPWHDTLVEFGYIKSYYGGDESMPTP